MVNINHASISGHGISDDGSNDPGAVQGNRIERDIVKVVTEFKNAFLRKYMVVTTDLDHGNGNLNKSVTLANNSNCDSYASQHANSSTGWAEGAECIYYPGSVEGAKLANCVRASVQMRLPVSFRRYIARDDSEVTNTYMTAIIWELGFLQSDKDYDNMVRLAKEYGEAIAMGIMDYHGLTNLYTADLKPKDTKAPIGKSVVNNGVVNYGSSYIVYAHGIEDESGIAGVQFPTWTDEKGQDDIVWHDGTNQGNGTWMCKINTSDHGNSRGLYITHVYAWDKSGNFGYIGATAVEMKKLESAVADIYPSKPSTFGDSFTIRVDNIKCATEIKKLTFPTWTKNAGQDDLIWKVGTKVDGTTVETWECTISRLDHKNEYGDYVIHVYLEDIYGNLVFLGETKVKLLTESDRIDALEKVLVDHEARIKELEK